MWQYAVLIFLPMAVQHIKIKNSIVSIRSNDSRKAAMKFFWFILLMMLLLRNTCVGADIVNYDRIFNIVNYSSWKQSVFRSPEIAFNALMKIIAVFFGNFRWMMTVSAVLSICFLALAYVRYTDDASLTIAIFVNTSNFVMLFSGLKQSIAISLGFLAFEKVRKKKLIPFIFIVLLAVLFHPSAFMLFLMYPLYYIKLTKKWIPGIVATLGIVFIFNRQIFGVLTRLLLMFTEYEGAITETGAYTMLILFGIFAVFSYIIPDEKKMDADTLGMRNFLLFAVALQMFAPLNSLAMRMGYYYIAFIPLVIPKVISYRRKRWNQVAIFARCIMIVFFAFYFFVTAPDNNVLNTFPYKFFWENPLV